MARASDPGGLPRAHSGEIGTSDNGPNPGGDLKIWDIFFGGVVPLMDSANYVSISYFTIFDYKIILKFLLIIGATEISKSKFLTISV